jgi:hypothetical protein
VMSKPSWRAFNAAMQLIAYLCHNRIDGEMVIYELKSNRWRFILLPNRED